MHDLIVSVADILGRPGEFRDLRIARPLPGVRHALARLDETPVRADVRAESVVEGVLVTGRVGGHATLECARCLSEFGSDVSVQVCELYVPEGRSSSEDEDVYELAGPEMDLEPMMRDALALSLPLKPLCREDCRGLCGGCGADLNAGACNCRDADTDPRWAELATLRERLTD